VKVRKRQKKTEFNSTFNPIHGSARGFGISDCQFLSFESLSQKMMTMYTGTWESSVVPTSIARGRIVASLDGPTALFTLTYEGTYRQHASWTQSLEWTEHIEPGKIIGDKTGVFQLCVSSSSAEAGIAGTYQIARDGVVDKGVFTLKPDELTASAFAIKEEEEEMKEHAPGGVQIGPSVPSGKFYETYHGHEVDHLRCILSGLKMRGKKHFVYLAGDSSLDSKYWLRSEARKDAVNGYEAILDPPECVPDVCYWLNYLLAIRPNRDTAAVMTAVEATTLDERLCRGLFPQDVFIRDHIQSGDTLVVSVGGNDIALAPTLMTTLHLASLLLLPAWSIKYNPSFQYFVHLFRDKVQEYIRQLTSKHRPRTILVCMIYFPCTVVDENSWCRALLRHTGYDKNPQHLQTLVREIFDAATSSIWIEGSCVVPIPLFDVLDADDASHYVQRVEPSSLGGQLMAAEFINYIA